MTAIQYGHKELVLLIYRKLNASGDYSFGRSMQDFVRDAEAVGQACKTNLLLLKGEWWEDLNEGLPLFQSILNQPGSPESLKAVDLIVKDRIANTKGVKSIQEFQSFLNSNREYSVTCTVITNTGSTATVEVSF